MWPWRKNRELRDALENLVRAADRMRDRWAECDEATRNRDLWRPLHDAADRGGEALYGKGGRP